MELNNQIVIYQTEDGQTQVDVRLENDTVWLTQAQMAELFETDRTSIVRHINNIYKVEELDRESTCAKISHVPFWNMWVMMVSRLIVQSIIILMLFFLLAMLTVEQGTALPSFRDRETFSLSSAPSFAFQGGE